MKDESNQKILQTIEACLAGKPLPSFREAEFQSTCDAIRALVGGIGDAMNPKLRAARESLGLSVLQLLNARLRQSAQAEKELAEHLHSGSATC